MKKNILSAIAITIVLLTALTVWKTEHRGSSGVQETGDAEVMTQSQAVAAAADGNWGLSFQTEGQPPVANATAEYLRQFDGWYTGTEQDVKDRCIYLTFDAGYENGYTEKILDVLKEEKVPAAFFVVGNYIEENPQLVMRMEEEGHLVGNHTMHHPDMSSIAGKEDFAGELTELEGLYQSVTGSPMKKYYRPPQGKYSEENLRQAHELGYRTVFWSLAYVDWYENDQPSREEALNLLNRRIHPGAVVLLHSTSKTNAEILQELLQGWKAQGYVFRSLEALGSEEGQGGQDTLETGKQPAAEERPAASEERPAASEDGQAG